MDFFVIQSEKFPKNHFFVVDQYNLDNKLNDSEYKRLQREEESETLNIFNTGGDDKFQIIRGKPYDFFVAIVKVPKW